MQSKAFPKGATFFSGSSKIGSGSFLWVPIPGWLRGTKRKPLSHGGGPHETHRIPEFLRIVQVCRGNLWLGSALALYVRETLLSHGFGPSKCGFQLYLSTTKDALHKSYQGCGTLKGRQLRAIPAGRLDWVWYGHVKVCVFYEGTLSSCQTKIEGNQSFFGFLILTIQPCVKPHNFWAKAI